MLSAADMPLACFPAASPGNIQGAASHGALPLATCRQGESNMDFDISDDLKQPRRPARRVMTLHRISAAARRPLDAEKAFAAGLWHRIISVFESALPTLPSSRIGGGSDQCLCNIIAEPVLVVPSDIRLDMGQPFNQVTMGWR
jgi:hypothetical protein